MNSEKLLDDFDVVFTIVVNKIYIRRNSFSFIGKMYQIALRCLYTYGSVDLLESPCNFLGSWLTQRPRAHMAECLPLAFSGASRHI